MQAANADELLSGEEADDDLCVVCWENVRKVVFCHCGHMVRLLNRVNALLVCRLYAVHVACRVSRLIHVLTPHNIFTQSPYAMYVISHLSACV